ncbi:MAG: hypothetical protein AAFO04_17485 [Cyanobacteria bacterium J06592_8]
MRTQELFHWNQCQIKGEIKLGKVLAVSTSQEWGEEKQQVCFQVEGEEIGKWIPVQAMLEDVKAIEVALETQPKVETEDIQEKLSA